MDIDILRDEINNDSLEETMTIWEVVKNGNRLYRFTNCLRN